MQSVSASTLVSHRILLGCNVVDGMLNGFYTQGITEIAGEAGSGKTQIALILSLQCSLPIESGGLNGNTAYLCCGEGDFPIKRLSQLANIYNTKYNKDNPKINFLENIHIETNYHVEQLLDTLQHKIPEICQKHGVRLLVIDSIGGILRSEYNTTESKEMKERTYILFKIAAQLKRLADAYSMCVIVINQVTATGFDEKEKSCVNDTTPTLGLAWSHCVNTRILLKRDLLMDLNQVEPINQDATTEKENQPTNFKSLRQMSVIFSPVVPPSTCKYQICTEGIKGLK